MVSEELVGLKVLVVYICVSRGQNTTSYSKRFAETWMQHPAGCDHQLLICCNGGILPASVEAEFRKIKPTPKFLLRNNDSGWDISGFQQVAHTTDAEFLVCLGESVHFWRDAWLARWVEARQQLGPGMYGPLATFNVRAHLHTTSFGIDPVYLRNYPPVRNHPERYEFEHGNGALWKRVKTSGGGAWLVTWDGVWEPKEWRMPEGIIWRGSQSNILVKCNHTQRFDEASPETRFRWAENADQRYKE